MKIFFCLGFMLTTFFATSQKRSATFDHIGMYVRNLDTSVAFYSGLFHFDSIPNPWANARVKWFKIGEHLQLHLVEGLKEPMKLPIMFHISFSVASVDTFIIELKKRSIPYYNGYGALNKTDTRVDGVTQLLFKDPDGYWLEVNNAAH